MSLRRLAGGSAWCRGNLSAGNHVFMNMRILALGAALLILATGCSTSPTSPDDPTPEPQISSQPAPVAAGWVRLDETPFPTRQPAASASIGDVTYVFGGREERCLTTADCVTVGPDLVDAWKLDVTTGHWDQLADLPVALRGEVSVAHVGSDLYLLSSCPGSSMLRYSPASDRWRAVPTPREVRRHHSLVTDGEVLIAVAGEGTAASGLHDYVFGSIKPHWRRLPIDGLPRSMQRVGFLLNDELHVLSRPVRVGSEPFVGATLGLASRQWRTAHPLRARETGTFVQADGLTFAVPITSRNLYQRDPDSGRWSVRSRAPGPIAGVLAGGQAAFVGGDGWVFDMSTTSGSSCHRSKATQSGA